MRVGTKQTDSMWNYGEAQKEFDRRLLTQYTPATVFVNEDMEIIHTRGNVNRYLKLAPGRHPKPFTRAAIRKTGA